jgi:hypothetical protein
MLWFQGHTESAAGASKTNWLRVASRVVRRHCVSFVPEFSSSSKRALLFFLENKRALIP